MSLSILNIFIKSCREMAAQTRYLCQRIVVTWLHKIDIFIVVTWLHRIDIFIDAREIAGRVHSSQKDTPNPKSLPRPEI